MPSIQVDLPLTVTVDAKQALARELGVLYARIMRASEDLVTVSVHDLGPGGVWRCHAGGPPTPSALVLCDIRRGRPVATRTELARALVATVAARFDLDPTWIKVELTQHAGDEMFHPHLGGMNSEWRPDEAGTADAPGTGPS